MPLPSFFSGLLGGASSSASMNLLGGYQRATAYTANIAQPNMALDVREYSNLYLNRLLDHSSFEDEMLQLGYKIRPFNPNQFRLANYNQFGWCELNKSAFTADMTPVERNLIFSKQMPSPDEALLLFNRGLITRELCLYWIQFAFGGENDLAKVYFTLKDQIPGPSDLVAFAVRDCFSPDIVQTFQYSQELPTAILPWMVKQGLGGEVGIAIPPGSTTTEGNETRTRAQWFDLYWWSHWALPSVGQGFEMLQRLYPDSPYGPSPYADNSTYFSPANLELLQKANDYPPFWRKRLQAIGYHPLSRVDIRRLFAGGVLKEDDTNHQVYHAYRQMGYDDTNAKILRDYAVKYALKPIEDATVGQVDKLYKSGAMSRDSAITALTAINYTRNNAILHISVLDLELKSAEIAAVVKQLRRLYLTGQANTDYIRAQLTTLGLESVAIERYLRIWLAEQQASFKETSAEKGIAWYKKGLISEDRLRVKLQNLHYFTADIELMIQEAKYDILVIQAKRIDAANKQAAKQVAANTKAAQAVLKAQAKAAQKAATQLQKDADKAHKEALAAYTDPNLKKWWKDGDINEQYVRNILVLRGFDNVAIDSWIEAYKPAT